MKQTLRLCLGMLLISISGITQTQSFTNPPKTFVTPTIGDRLITLMKKLGNTLDERRASIGEIILATTTISEPGLYVLGTDIAGNITINTDDVWLNLNGYEVYDSSGTTHGITVNNYKKNITIENGTVRGTGAETSTTTGIRILEGASFVHIENVRIKDFDKGIALNGFEGEVKSCKIKNCSFKSNNIGVYLIRAIKNVFEHCTAYNCIEAGFELIYSEHNVFEKCYALETKNSAPDEPAIGFSTRIGKGNLFYECISKGTEKTNSNFCQHATGFLLTGAEEETEIYNSIAGNSKATEYGNAYGIQLNEEIKSTPLNSPLYSNSSFSTRQRSIDWSPEYNYILTSGHDNTAKVYYFNGSSLTLIATVNPNGRYVRCARWSPDGTYIVLTTYAYPDNDQTPPPPAGDEVFVYRFDPFAIDPSDRLIFIDSVNIDYNIYSAVWSHDGKSIAIGSRPETGAQPENYELQVWRFNGANLEFSSSVIGAHDPDIFVIRPSFTPDDKYLAAVYWSSETYPNNIEIFKFDPMAADYPTVNALTSKKLQSTTSVQGMYFVEWSPITAGGIYYLAASGIRGNNTAIEILAYDSSANTLTSIETYDYAGTGNSQDDREVELGTIYSVRWSPNGKYLFATGTIHNSKNILMFEFNSTASPGSRLTLLQTAYIPVGRILESCWSPDGRYVGAIGGEFDESGGFALYEVASAPRRCIIKQNEIHNCTGGLAGIGLAGASGANLIIKNICYENSLNTQWGVYNTFKNGLNGSPTNIENISVPPYED